MSNVTPWFLVGSENPLRERPGIYEVRFTCPSGPVMRVLWTGRRWQRAGNQYQPSESWGDLWRGLREPAE